MDDTAIIQKLLNVLYSDGQYIQLKDRDDDIKYVGYSYFNTSISTMFEKLPLVVELTYCPKCGVHITVLPYLAYSTWIHEADEDHEKDCPYFIIGYLTGLVQPIFGTKFPIEARAFDTKVSVVINLEEDDA
jgi:hypothetical protein